MVYMLSHPFKTGQEDLKMAGRPTSGADRSKLTGSALWQNPGGSVTAEKDLDLILGSVKNLPILYWRPSFFFFGARDEDLSDLTDHRFPAKLVPGRSHPVFSLRPLPNDVGFKVCPCTSKTPRIRSSFRFIQKGCLLDYTGYEMDRKSYLIEGITFNIPRSVAIGLRFRGKVPSECLITEKQRKKV